MRTVVSRVAPSGHVVLARVPDQGRFLAAYADDGSQRDLTDFVANLLLTGALDVREQQDAERPDPSEEVAVAEVVYVEKPPAPGEMRQPATFTWMHLPTAEAGDFDPAEVLGLLVRGLSVEITAMVAHEAAQVPDEVPDQLSEETSQDTPGDPSSERDTAS